MIKQTLYFGSSQYIRTEKDQLIFVSNKDTAISRPIEDIGIILLDHPQITITHQAIRALQANKVAIISCDESHMPYSVMLPLSGHTLYTKRVRYQLEASLSLRRQLWQQTVRAKIANQAAVLDRYGGRAQQLKALIKRVQSGDSTNVEGQAAYYYWRALIPHTIRGRDGDAPNHLLNYGYAILRSMVARALVSSGLNLVIGIHHKNQYNPYCLADDIMEPFRPFVDDIVMELWHSGYVEGDQLSKVHKVALLKVATAEAIYKKRRSPLMVGMTQTCASLAACFDGSKRRIVYPEMILES